MEHFHFDPAYDGPTALSQRVRTPRERATRYSLSLSLPDAVLQRVGYAIVFDRAGAAEDGFGASFAYRRRMQVQGRPN